MDWFTKAYALLHDPPHKTLWFEDKNYRIYNKESHEEEARHMLYAVLIATPLGGGAPPPNVANRVKTADRIAASFDRWALQPPSGGYWVKAERLYNPFNYKYSIEIKRPTPQEFVAQLTDYVYDLNMLLRTAGDERETYFLLYATAELLWALKGLPALPADTRVPTHTIFDHLYATASVMNWIGDDGGPRGCFLEIDVPGIQKVIGSARKAGDYRAGSLLVSLAVWLTAWQYMREHGPDVLLSPTPRFNPLFYLQLARELKGGRKALELYASFVVEVLEFREVLERGKKDKHDEEPEVVITDFFVRRASVVPGTAYLMLPSCGDAEKAPERFEKALTAVKDAVLGATPQDLQLPIPLHVDAQSPVFKLGKAALQKMPMPYLPFKYRYVSIEEAYEEANKIRQRLVDRGFSLETERLLFYAAWRVLHRKTAIPRVPSWFSRGGVPNFVKLYDGPWIHSTLDPDQPASLKLGQDPATLDYDADTKAMLGKVLGPDWSSAEAPKELRRVFKPKEALGPVDVLKRLLYYAVSGGDIPSVEATALRWHYERGWAEECPPDVREVVRKVVEGGDAEELVGPSPAPDNALMRCKPKDAETPPLSFMYVIIHADGDYAGKLARGCVRGLRDEKGDVVKPTLEAVLPPARGEDDPWRQDREAVIKAVGVVQMFKEEECEDLACVFPDVFFVIPSPAYYAAFSASLMITALKDVKNVVKHSGDVVYAGGDDLLAFAARPAALAIVRETREAYHGEEGFHKLKNYALPAPAAYGRSYSVRLAHSITDFMAVEVEKTREALEEAKEHVKGKDALAISTSTGHVGVVKTEAADAVGEIIKAYLRRDLSRNLPYDMERTYTPDGEKEETKRKAEEILLPHLVKRNAKKPKREELAEKLAKLHGDMWRYLDRTKPREDLKEPWLNMAGLLKAVREFL